MASVINQTFMQIPKRAETNQRSTLLATFVDVGPLFTLLSTTDHQVLYGRRGTGKTHALSYLAEKQEAKGDAVAFVDLRNIGSTGGLYADQSVLVRPVSVAVFSDSQVQPVRQIIVLPHDDNELGVECRLQ